ncbi:unnamed protein product [Durusdinium trenchii]|uniref:U-box domain-containing protein n=1 Tax=Durusdinium trenchii TaxID=1381693 RepID=A0ABP0MFH1_9DINO
MASCFHLKRDEIFPQVAKKFPQATDWLCPIRGLIMKDPVTAEDGFNYEREAIQEWFQRSTKSPQSQSEIGTELKPNKALQEVIQQFTDFAETMSKAGSSLSLTWPSHGMMPETERKVTLSLEDVSVVNSQPTQMCQALSRFFKEVDPVEDLLHNMLNGLKPPKIVVVGDENAGKSTILEMLAMIPVFPRRRSCSTLLAIHLRLRRHPGMSRATLRVLPADGQETGEAGEVVCMDMPQENGWLMVQEQMTRLRKELTKESGIVSEKIIVVEVRRSDVPCLDLVDLPGLTTSPPEKAAQINRIYEQQLEDDRRNGNHNMYLAIVPAAGDFVPTNHNAWKFIEEKGLQDRTFGVFSKCDQNSDADFLRAVTLDEPAEQDGSSPESLGAARLSNGWVVTMQKPPHEGYFKHHNYERLNWQLKQEEEWFSSPKVPDQQRHFPRLLAGQCAGIAQLVARLENGYCLNLKQNWKELAMAKTFEKEAIVEFDIKMLGVVEDLDRRQQLAEEEVQRRLGPNSDVTKGMYNRFVQDVLHKRVPDQVRQILADFAVGQKCSGHAFKKVLQKKKDQLTALLNDVLQRQKSMGDEVGHILSFESKVCKDGPCDFNISTASLRLYPSKGCKSKWNIQERLQEGPIIQLCHYKNYLQAIMQKYKEMVGTAEASLRNSGEKLIERFFDVDSLSPYLEVKSSFLCSSDGERDFTDRQVIISCKWQDFLHSFLRCCYEHLPDPVMLQDLSQGIAVGDETNEARARFDCLQKEYGLVKTAKEHLIRALEIEDADLTRMKYKFEVDQHAKSELQEAPSLCCEVSSGSDGSWEAITTPSATPEARDEAGVQQKDDADQEEHSSLVGAEVRISGLQSAVDLNGLEGKLLFFDKGRWQVSLHEKDSLYQASEVIKLIKPENLLLRGADGMWESITSKASQVSTSLAAPQQRISTENQLFEWDQLNEEHDAAESAEVQQESGADLNGSASPPLLGGSPSEELSNEIRQKKEQLKAQGLSGKKCDQDPEVKEMVEKLQQLKSAKATAAPAAAAPALAATIASVFPFGTLAPETPPVPAAVANGADLDAEIAALGNEIRQKKEELKAQGLSGKKCDQDPEAPRRSVCSVLAI